MVRQRVIVGIGEALLCEFPDRVEPGGIALASARHAQRMGHTGVPISRLGQDLTANELLTQLKGWGLIVEHLQSDPDLPTGRLVVRSIGGKMKRSLQPRAAFDNLQWDFDLEDVATQADAVVFGLLAQRDGQAESVIRRFIAECAHAVRVFDLCNREGDEIDRTKMRSKLDSTDGIIVDGAALHALTPGWDGTDVVAAAKSITRGRELAFIVTIEGSDSNERMIAHAAGVSNSASRLYPADQHEAAVVGFIHGILNGWDMPRCLAVACSVAEHAAKSPDDPVPAEVL